MIVHFADGRLAGQTREIPDGNIGFVYDASIKENLRWHYLLVGNQMLLFWVGSIAKWHEYKVLDAFMRFLERHK